ncbi:MAG: M67 family metallopeptidase [Desulfohalobiaceae bacterium]|nr:M67 family metallopeptidase [Desulfohalobiaceae bacterium]
MLAIRKQDLEDVLQHVRSEVSHEGCGILGGRDCRVLRVYRMSNIEDSSDRYFMDIGELAAAIQDLYHEDLDIVGIYHSHVCGPAYPSPLDVERAYYPDACYVIISLADPENPDIRGFRIREGTIRKEQILLE